MPLENVKNKLFIEIIALSLLSTTFAQQETELPIVEKDVAHEKFIYVDSLLEKNETYSTDNAVFTHHFSENLATKYNTPEFDYTQKEFKESAWQRFKRKLYDFFKNFIETNSLDASDKVIWFILKILAVISVGGAIYFLLRFFLSKRGSWVFSKKGQTVGVHEFTIEENIHQLDLSALILQAEQSTNYRLAVRYLFLQFLKELTLRAIVEWNPEKTNLDYQREIKENTTKKRFQKLAYYYENIWYGERSIHANEYASLKVEFEKSTLNHE